MAVYIVTNQLLVLLVVVLIASYCWLNRLSWMRRSGEIWRNFMVLSTKPPSRSWEAWIPVQLAVDQAQAHRAMAMVRYVSFVWNIWPLAPLPLELALSAVLGNFFFKLYRVVSFVCFQFRLVDIVDVIGVFCAVCLLCCILAGHLYHRSCAVLWLDRSDTCPTCRRRVSLEHE